MKEDRLSWTPFSLRRRSGWRPRDASLLCPTCDNMWQFGLGLLYRMGGLSSIS